MGALGIKAVAQSGLKDTKGFSFQLPTSLTANDFVASYFLEIYFHFYHEKGRRYFIL